MKHFMLLVGIVAVISQTNADYLREVLEVKPHYAPDICTSMPNWALLPHPYDCHKFYVCANHMPEEMKCLQNYYFDKEKNRCIFGPCANIRNCQEGWVRRVEDNCQAFEFCRNGNYIREYCQSGSYFNEVLSICKTIDDSPQHKCSCILPDYSIVKNAKNCSSYYICANGQPMLKSCERGYYFNSYLNACLIDLHGVCFAESTMSTEEIAKAEVCKRTGLNDDDNNHVARINFQPDTEDCRKFYMCINGRALIKYCPEGFYYNRELRFCEEDTYGHACEALIEQAEKKLEEEEKETQQHEVEIEMNHLHNVDNREMDEDDSKPPVKLALSMTHIGLDVEKNADKIKHAEESNDVKIIMPAQTDALKTPIIPPKSPIDVHSKHNNEEETTDVEEMANNSAEITNSNIIEMKLPLSELKLPTKSQYDKLASKFISF